MKPCTGCRYLNAEYLGGPLCYHPSSRVAKHDPYTQKTLVSHQLVKEARADGGFCGPEASKYGPKLLVRVWRRRKALASSRKP